MCNEDEEPLGKIVIPVMIGDVQYYISADRYNFILGQRKTSIVKGKEYVGYSLKASYFSTLENLMLHLHTRKLKQVPATTLDELQRNIRTVKDEVRGIYQEMQLDELIERDN